MKLRMHGNSLRLRLNRAEVARLAETGRVEEVVQFGPGVAFRYALETAPDADALRALLVDGGVRVLVPETKAREWASTERVAVSGEQATLNILVEKDFQCLHGESEVDPDAFPNPLHTRD
jgi:Family of unknown function (DUF7009)